MPRMTTLSSYSPIVYYTSQLCTIGYGNVSRTWMATPAFIFFWVYSPWRINCNIVFNLYLLITLWNMFKLICTDTGTFQCIWLFWELNTCLVNTGCLLSGQVLLYRICYKMTALGFIRHELLPLNCFPCCSCQFNILYTISFKLPFLLLYL